MRRALAALGLCAILAGCGFRTRSDRFACDVTVDCDGERVCVDGWCVAAGGGDADGPTGECPAECTGGCSGDLCAIACVVDESCPFRVVCPAGYECAVTCSGDETCVSGVDCTTSTACSVICSGTNSCVGPIDCPTGACDVTCAGPGSCLAAVDCSDSCACDVDCSAGCLQAPACPGGAQCAAVPIGCDSAPSGCDTCE